MNVRPWAENIWFSPCYVINELARTVATRDKKKIKRAKEAGDLKEALEKHGVRVLVELHDGYKHVDLAIPKARLNIEVDGIQHLTNPQQIVADLNRGYYSHQNGFNTMHIPNEMIRLHLKEISEALAEASKIREKKIHVHLD